MTISYTIDPRRDLILTTVTDSLTIEDLLAHKAALLADDQFHPGLRELSDVRGVDELDLDLADMRRLIAFDAQHATALGAYRLALVVPPGFVFGLARMYQQMTESSLPQVRVFESPVEAAKWLDVPLA